MNSLDTQRSRRLPRADAIGALLFVLVHGTLLLAWPVVLAQDAPLWISEGALLHTFLAATPVGDCRLVAAIPPNAISQSVISLLCYVVSPELAGRLYIVACMGLFVAALVYLFRGRPAAGRERALLICLPLCVGYPLFHGFLNYMAALPALCFGIGFLLRNPEGRGARGVGVLLLMPLVTYLCHGTAVGIWAVLVCAQVWVRRSRGLALRALPGFIPVVLLTAAYIGQRQGEGASLLWSAGSLVATVIYRLRSPLRFFGVFPGFEPLIGNRSFGYIAPLLLVANSVYAVAISIVGLRWAWRARYDPDANERWLSRCLLALAALFVVMPHDVAGMLNPAERLLLPAACLGAAGICGSAYSGTASTSQRARLRYALYALLGSQWVYLAVWGTQAATITDAFVQTREHYASVGAVSVVQADDIVLPGGATAPRLARASQMMTRHQVELHQDMLADWTHGRPIAPPVTGLFRCPAGVAEPTDFASLKSADRALLLIGDPERTAALAQAFAPEFRVVRPGPGFWTLVRSGVPMP